MRHYLLNALSWCQQLNANVLRWAGFGILIMTLSVWAGLTLREPNTFPIKQVVIEGDYHHVDRTRFQNEIMPLVNTGFFSIDVDKIQDRLATLPWIANAHVKRVWPDEINITVNERQAIAIWQGRSLLDVQGQLFSPDPSSFPDDLIELSGPSGHQKEMVRLLKIFNHQLAMLNLWVVRMHLSPSLSVSIELSNHVMLVLGQAERAKRLARFLLVYERIIANKKQSLTYADLRYPKGFAARWR